MNTAMAQSCILLPDKPGQEQLCVIATERQLTGAIKKKKKKKKKQNERTASSPEPDRYRCRFTKSRGGECYTLNIVSHTTLFVKGSFAVTDLNQHLFFIKVTGSHSRGTVRCADSHLEIDLSKL